MAKFFRFVDRFIPVHFFGEGEDGLTITMKICDETDRKIIEAGKIFTRADKSEDLTERCELYRLALETIIGTDYTAEILEKADEADSFAILSVWTYILKEYRSAKAKNLSSSAG